MKTDNNKLSETSITIIKDLIKDMNDLLLKGSNIEVAWGLENIHNEKSLIKNANRIKKSICSM